MVIIGLGALITGLVALWWSRSFVPAQMRALHVRVVLRARPRRRRRLEFARGAADWAGRILLIVGALLLVLGIALPD